MENEHLIFNIEYQYELYLKRMDLTESAMNPIQKIETKRAFMGGMGQCLMLLTNELADLPEDHAEMQLKVMIDEIGEYFTAECEIFTMKKESFNETKQGTHGLILLAKCPSCGDTVVYGDGCVKCDAVFKFN